MCSHAEHPQCSSILSLTMIWNGCARINGGATVYTTMVQSLTTTNGRLTLEILYSQSTVRLSVMHYSREVDNIFLDTTLLSYSDNEEYSDIACTDSVLSYPQLTVRFEEGKGVQSQSGPLSRLSAEKYHTGLCYLHRALVSCMLVKICTAPTLLERICVASNLVILTLPMPIYPVLT